MCVGDPVSWYPVVDIQLKNLCSSVPVSWSVYYKQCGWKRWSMTFLMRWRKQLAQQAVADDGAYVVEQDQLEISVSIMAFSAYFVPYY